MTRTKTIHYTLCGLEYVYIVNAPLGVDNGEEYIDIPPEQIDRNHGPLVIDHSQNE